MFQWDDFRQIADDLILKSEESYIRSAASRYYYSLFGSTREYLIDVMHKYEFENRNNIHQKVYDELIQSDDLNEVNLAKCLNYLRVVRNHADYDNCGDCPDYFKKREAKIVDKTNQGYKSLEVLMNNPPFKL